MTEKIIFETRLGKLSNEYNDISKIETLNIEKGIFS